MKTITGPFTVRLTPQAASQAMADTGIGRQSIDKQFHGPLEASSCGEMLGMYNPERQSGGYVALELVTGNLEGHQGSFVLQHNSTISATDSHQSIQVVPNSGTGDLQGLRGSMQIENISGQHQYVFEYSLE